MFGGYRRGGLGCGFPLWGISEYFIISILFTVFLLWFICRDVEAAMGDFAYMWK